MITLALGVFLMRGKIAAKCAEAGISVAKLSSISARHLSALPPNTSFTALITLLPSSSLPALIRQANKSLPSPVARVNTAGLRSV